MTDPNPDNLNENTPTDPRLDPRMQALLDEALSPGDVPAGLNDRILAATADRFTEDVDDAPAVIGKIGGGFAWRSIAAVLLFALILGGVWVANQDSEPGNNGTLAGGDTVERAQLDTTQIESVLDQLAEAELEGRRKAWLPRTNDYQSGTLWRYSQNVGSAREGALTHPGAKAETHVYADI